MCYLGEFLKRTWAQVNLDAIQHNYRVIREAVNPRTKICCVIKADAYGHGAGFIAREFEKLGADWLAVSNLEEAVQIRHCGVKMPVLILGYTPPQMAAQLSEMNFSQTVLSLPYGEALSRCAVKAGVTVKVHIKVDSGMCRIGFLYQELGRDSGAIDEMERVCRLPGIDPEGIFTHFSVSDEGENGERFTMKQYGCFKDAIEELQYRGIHFRLRHCANSAAVLDYPETHLDMVRPGIILYGLVPSSQTRKHLDLIPAMELKTIISMLKTVQADTGVSYGRSFFTKAPTVLATVPIGYADGYPRALHDRADVLVNGNRARVVGRVCMDQMMLDVTGIPGVEEGMTVTCFGTDHGSVLALDELASLYGTISYEMVCLVGKRVPRIYFRDGKEVGQLNYICPEFY